MRKQIKSTFRAKSTGLSMVLDSLREEGSIYFEGLFDHFKVITWIVDNPETTPRESSVLFLKLDTDIISCGLSFDTDTGHPTFGFDEDNWKSAPILMYNYISDLFHTSSDIQFITNTRSFEDLPNIKVFKNFYHEGLRLAGSKLDVFFETHEITNCAVILPYIMTDTLFTRGSIKRRSSLLKIKNLLVYKANFLVINNILSFRGSHAVFLESYIKNNDIIKFLNLWLSGRFRRLDYLLITPLYHAPLNPEAILGKFNTMPFDESRRSAMYINKTAMIDFIPARLRQPDWSKEPLVVLQSVVQLASVLSDYKSNVDYKKHVRNCMYSVVVLLRIHQNGRIFESMLTKDGRISENIGILHVVRRQARQAFLCSGMVKSCELKWLWLDDSFNAQPKNRQHPTIRAFLKNSRIRIKQARIALHKRNT
ncbi:hypothetical protein GCK72_006483 [Caenorhabditis remanei]|uniref:F-box associated domain-containing protein n=1 Tax=Caenorhabditis remanei TaxID=31234 RepID=A0A6A5HIK8_CAERE|nr:hypothetical protein GCK72_006483 [Caenorhabditis remanei]KAF1766526.1 hypothetical protein GCK72_006483 [Caenorhabditis remanei]